MYQKSSSLYYSFDLECPLKAHVVKDWSSRQQCTEIGPLEVNVIHPLMD
jgi:hypothetical protein